MATTTFPSSDDRDGWRVFSAWLGERQILRFPEEEPRDFWDSQSDVSTIEVPLDDIEPDPEEVARQERLQRETERRARKLAERRREQELASQTNAEVSESDSEESDIDVEGIRRSVMAQLAIRSSERAEATTGDGHASALSSGPEKPTVTAESLVVDPSTIKVDYGKSLRPGEGQAMAGFVQSGKRIPRRGEVGLTANEIERFESLGYVMSGSRHRRINAVRLRKETQVYTAEQERALAIFNVEERALKEKLVMNDLAELLKNQREKIEESLSRHSKS